MPPARIRAAAAIVQIVFAAVVIVVLQRFGAGLGIVSGLAYLNNAPKGEDNKPREKRTLERFCKRCGGCCMQTMWG